MHKLYELKDMLCEELEGYGSKEKLDVGGLDIVDKLAHAIKNIDKIIESYEEDGYSGRSYRSMATDGMSYGRGSYARGRRNVRRDAMGRYSGADDMMAELHELMANAPDERTRQEFQRFISKMEQM